MKERRTFLRRLGGFGAFAAISPAAGAASPVREGQGAFVHVVFFWLKDDHPETRQKFESELRPFIAGVDEIQSRHIGTPADTDREVIDNTWDYSLVLGFKSKKEQDIYQEHPLHKRFIENASMLWDKVLVYDSIQS